MPYQLIFSEQPDEKGKDVGDNIFLDNLPADYKVYLFYYPDVMGNPELETHLRKLGDISGKNLFVNMGKLNDPNYKKVADKFQIKALPVVVMTAVSDLASPPASFLSTYVKIDNKKVLASPDKVIELLEKTFNLFVSGNIAGAIKEVKKADRNTLIASFTKVIIDGLKGLWKFIDERDISFSVAEGKFELKHH